MRWPQTKSACQLLCFGGDDDHHHDDHDNRNDCIHADDEDLGEVAADKECLPTPPP